MIASHEDALDAAYLKVVNAITRRPVPVGSRRSDRALALYDAATELREAWGSLPRPDLSEDEIVARQRAAIDAWFCLVERKDMITDV